MLQRFLGMLKRFLRVVIGACFYGFLQMRNGFFLVRDTFLGVLDYFLKRSGAGQVQHWGLQVEALMSNTG